VRKTLRAAGLFAVAVAIVVSVVGPVQVGAALFVAGVVVVLATVLF
jgi:hypothetical protein